jgi:hypothetical protein
MKAVGGKIIGHISVSFLKKLPYPISAAAKKSWSLLERSQRKDWMSYLLTLIAVANTAKTKEQTI